MAKKFKTTRKRTPARKRVTRVAGIKKFKIGMFLKQNYSWTGEPTKTYYHRVTEVIQGGSGAYTIIYKVKLNGKIDKYNPSLGRRSFFWTYSTQIGKIKSFKGSGRVVRVKK